VTETADPKSLPIRFVPDLGMFAFSRGKATCLWSTKWCRKRCYNHKFYRINPKLVDIDQRDNFWWSGTRTPDFLTMMEKVGVKDRFRFAVRGEAWTCDDDVERIREIALARKDVTFWIPTRAWRDKDLAPVIGVRLLRLMNVRVMASIDPTTADPFDLQRLQDWGWRMLFAGDNAHGNQCLLGEGAVIRDPVYSRYHRCEKTWLDEKGACATCTEGCFSPKRVDVHLKQHR